MVYVDIMHVVQGKKLMYLAVWLTLYFTGRYPASEKVIIRISMVEFYRQLVLTYMCSTICI